jgi:Tol biopolymer transport system component
MGDVYKARDTRLGRTVAIKVLPTRLAGDPEFRSRLDREAKLISKLNHPHVCTLYDVGRHGETHFLVMEYVAGETLATRLVGGPLPLETALRHAIEIADALDRAHREGVVHRDLKPSNVMLTPAGAKLLDFGLARPLRPRSDPDARPDAEPSDQTLTRSGTILGTVPYMAPEQLEGRPADARSDLFSFGAVLYEMVTGRRAFAGASQANVIAAILDHDPPAMTVTQPLVPPALEWTVRRCLAKDADHRWQTATDLESHLRWVKDEGLRLDRGEPAVPAHPRRLLWVLATITALALAGAAAVSLWRRDTPSRAVIRFTVPAPQGTEHVPNFAFSPDGRRLAFTTLDKQGGRALWVQPLDSLTPQQFPRTDGARHPFWSPDGRFVAFFATDKLKKLELETGNVETLCEAPIPYGGTWSWEGTILFASSGVLSKVPASGGVPGPVTQLDATKGEDAHVWPQFLPDGRHYLYVRVGGGKGNTGTFVGRLGSPELKQILRVTSRDDATSAAYAAGYLFYVRKGVLMGHRFDPERLELSGEAVPLGEGVEVTKGGGPLRTALAVSPAGALAYRAASLPAPVQLTWFDRSGHEAGRLAEPGPYDSVALSPDGRQVLASRPESDGSESIHRIDVAPGTTVRLGLGHTSGGPVWAPDGARFVYWALGGGPPNPHINAVGAAGTGDQLIRSATPHYPSDWSTDGRYVVGDAQYPETKRDVWAVEVSGERKVTYPVRTPFNEQNPHLSPDCRWLAYESDDSGAFEIYVQSFPAGAGRWRVSTKGGRDPRWRRDGRELLYVARDMTLTRVAIGNGTEFGAGNPDPLFRNSALENGYQASPDGRRFLVSVPAGEPSSPPIVVMLNWQAAVKR